jgi:hypothetical protein
VDARLVARDYWLKPIYPEQMPYVAAELLASGYDSPSLREAAGVSAADSREARRLFIEALQELGVWLDEERQAALWQAASLARSFTRDEISIDSFVSALMNLWELDDVMYGGVAEPAERLASLAWTHEHPAYEENGGDEALRSEAEIVASFYQGEQ